MKNCKVLAPQKGHLKKIITYCPTDKAAMVRNAMFSAGGGNIGNYSDCSYNSEGQGTFKGNEKTSPFVGKSGPRIIFRKSFIDNFGLSRRAITASRVSFKL